MATPAQHIVRLALGFAVSQALRVVADLEIAERLAAGERSVDELAAETSSHPDALYRIMRLLAAEGVFRETDARRPHPLHVKTGRNRKLRRSLRCCLG